MTKQRFWLIPAAGLIGLLAAALLLMPLVLGPKPALGQAPSPSICDQNVAEASSYSLVYRLPIPVIANYNNALPPYSVDNTTSIGSFDRIAYCLQLDNQWIWVSMDAFTTVPAQVGVPVISTGAVFQQIVSNMNVFSNVAGIVTGTGITTGNIEFWHHCYAAPVRLGLPGASSSLFDFDDDGPVVAPNLTSCYGSMQVHNHGTTQTLFAYNRWDRPAGGNSDLGIGNSPSGHPDWTFRVNAGTYTVRTMDILVVVSDADGPITSNVVAAPNPVAVDTAIALTANVDDSTTGGSDIASAEYNIDGGSFVAMSASDAAFDEVSEDVTAGVPAFTEPGLHIVCVHGTDAPGNVGADECILLVVYDPTAGFVTGGGWVNSPAGVDTDNLSAAGRANFGFVSKYHRGRTTPDGNLQFQFKAGDLKFKSTSMEWLVVTGEPRAMFRGEGTINGVTVCKFQVDAWDASFGGGVDAFGIKIFACGAGGDRYSLDATPLEGGSIKIHRK